MTQVLPKEERMDDVDRIRIGFMLPIFTLKDSGSKEVNLAEFWGKKDIVLFFLDDYLCNECGRFLSEVQNKLKEITALDAAALAVSIDHPRFLNKLKQKLNLEFPLLYDQNSVVTKLYGLLNSGSPKGAPHPTVFVADKERVISYKKVNLDHKNGLRIEEIIESLKKYQ
ncbi:MAG: alkyl hydroperoxide reductase [candidate division Zixibacteria bacterium RBG-1]|nr:MAG: alkyl hydroperoxide reductase [candidate division Zixibacteria bacterium RBG-1]